MTTRHARLLSALDGAALCTIAEHAERVAPDECCGYVTDDGVRPCENDQARLHKAHPAQFPRTARTAFRLAAADQLALARSFDGRDPARVLYHSHIDIGPYFSETDLAGATFDGRPLYPDLLHLVVSVRDGRAVDAVAFAIVEGAAVEVASFDLASLDLASFEFSEGRGSPPPAGTSGPDAPRTR